MYRHFLARCQLHSRPLFSSCHHAFVHGHATALPVKSSRGFMNQCQNIGYRRSNRVGNEHSHPQPALDAHQRTSKQKLPRIPFCLVPSPKPKAMLVRLRGIALHLTFRNQHPSVEGPKPSPAWPPSEHDTALTSPMSTPALGSHFGAHLRPLLRWPAAALLVLDTS